MRQAFVILALLGGLHAQTVVVGRTDTTGRLVISPRGTVTTAGLTGKAVWNAGTVSVSTITTASASPAEIKR